MSEGADVIELGVGLYWQDLRVGQVFRTLRRTIREADLVAFIGTTGMLEEMFIDADFDAGAMSGRVVPGALTYCLIEGFILQTMIQRTGLALLEVHQKMHAPVLVGDTIHGDVEVTSIKPTSKKGRAVVASKVQVFNGKGTLVLSYDVTRLLRGRPGVEG